MAGHIQDFAFVLWFHLLLRLLQLQWQPQWYNRQQEQLDLFVLLVLLLLPEPIGDCLDE